jgi:single-strand DNA-binding protein
MYELGITIIGNVCSDVRHVVLENNVTVASFRVASTQRRYRNGNWVDGATTYASVTCWRAMADHVASSVRMGDPVIVHGRMSMRTWEKDERTGQTLEVEAYGVGHDLRWGTSAFQRAARKEAEVTDTEAVAAELATSYDRDAAGLSLGSRAGDGDRAADVDGERSEHGDDERGDHGNDERSERAAEEVAA